MHLLRGVLGWSNKRVGSLEFYQWHEKIIPRHNSEWGDLLVDEIPTNHEGCIVLVIVMDRGMEAEDVEKALEGLRYDRTA